MPKPELPFSLLVVKFIHNTSINKCLHQTKKKKQAKLVFGGQGWIRTIVLIREQIYSLPPLATRPPTQIFNYIKMVRPQGFEPWTHRL